MFCFTFVSDHNTDFLMLYSVQLKNMYSYLNKLFETVRYCTWSLLSTIVLQLIIIIQTHNHLSFYFILLIFTFSIFIMFSLIPSDANDPQGLMRRQEPNKQTNYCTLSDRHLIFYNKHGAPAFHKTLSLLQSSLYA